MATRGKAASKQKPAELDPVSKRLEFLAGLMVLKPDANDTEKIAVAARVGLDGAAVARIFDRTPGAASKAVERARKA